MTFRSETYFFSIQETTLSDLLQLNLHCFEEEVRGIVEKAVKEMGMEKVLSELNSTWTGTELDSPYKPISILCIVHKDNTSDRNVIVYILIKTFEQLGQGHVYHCLISSMSILAIICKHLGTEETNCSDFESRNFPNCAL